MKRLTAVLPCFGRPMRTRRMIECIEKQNIDNWELIIAGDCCPDFDKLSNSKWYSGFVELISKRGNRILSYNSHRNHGGYGYYLINNAIKWATGNYFIFLGNDDVIINNHFEHYVSGIENTDLDFVYYNSWVNPHNMLRMSQPIQGAIGHSELIIRTEFLKTIPPHGPEYGHDWKLVQDMMDRTDKHKKIPGEEPTYYIMSVPGKLETGID